MAAHFTGAISLFDADPDLTARLDCRQAAAARARALAPLAILPPGEWDLRCWTGGDANRHLGLLVLDGLLTRNTTLVGRTTMEIVGARDIVRPWDDDDAASVPQSVSWTVHLPTRVALLDHRFVERVAPWPEITRALLIRSVQRAQRLGRHLAILENPRVDARLLLLFWHLADGWGTVGPHGVTVPLHLTHKTLGRMVRAQRPSVTASLHELSARGLLTRRHGDGAWQLHGEPGLQMRVLQDAA